MAGGLWNRDKPDSRTVGSVDKGLQLRDGGQVIVSAFVRQFGSVLHQIASAEKASKDLR